MKNYKQGLNKKQYEDLTIDSIDQSQLSSESNSVEIRKLTENELAKDYGQINKDKNVDSGMAYSASTKSGSEMSPHYAETKRFAKDVDIDGLEDNVRKNEKMKLNQAVDDTASP